MTDTETIKRDLAAFSAAYDYDVSYVVELLDHSPGAYAAFAAVQPLGNYRSVLPRDAHWVASIATALAEDCGACAQLGLRRAVQDGVDRELLRQLLDAPSLLPGALADVYAHARAVCGGAADDAERAARLRAAYGETGLAELAVCITGCRLYPTLKRALFKNGACRKPTLDF
jgi:hypothetical protein